MTHDQRLLLFFLANANGIALRIPCPCKIEGPLDMHDNNCYKPRLIIVEQLAREALEKEDGE